MEIEGSSCSVMSSNIHLYYRREKLFQARMFITDDDRRTKWCIHSLTYGSVSRWSSKQNQPTFVCVCFRSGSDVVSADCDGELYESEKLQRHLPTAGQQAENIRWTERPTEVPDGIWAQCVSRPDPGLKLWYKSLHLKLEQQFNVLVFYIVLQAAGSRRDGPAGQ